METSYLSAGELDRAAAILRAGGLVGIPTETVYGLGANGLDPEAVSRIFAAKGRPQDNPLILHIPEASWLERYCQNIPATVSVLAEAFWPGPLTMILPRRPLVPDVVTAGLDTVGMRCPAHPLCREIIRLADVPVAAPSGNTSGRPSPTTAQHMREDMDGKIDAIVDGGPCAVGVESTILDLTCTPPRLLRPGGVTLEQLREVLGEVEVDPAVTRLMGEGEQPRAPGMKYRHYAPKAPVTVVTGRPEASASYIAAHAAPQDGIICFAEFTAQFPAAAAEGRVMELGPAGDQEEQARHIFDALRAFDHTDVPAIWAQCPDCKGIGLAIANRLNKAAGFHVIQAEPQGAGWDV
jgi:L-threonylcarbamoyladenylate synthase